MKYRLRIITVILLVATSAGMVVPGLARPESTRLDEVDAYIAETLHRLPIKGLSLAIVKGDQVLYLQGYGTANATGDPATPQTAFMLASVTKTFTALAIQQLTMTGRLHLDDRLQTYIPEFRLDDADSAAAITIRHLLAHTSGISTQEGTRPYLHSPDTTLVEALDRLARYKPSHPPGAQYEYSNWNYVLLGEVITRVSGQPYTEYMQANILDPLDMTHASFDDYHTLPGVATGNLILFGAPIPYDEKHIPVMLSAGYLTASAEDMAHYLIAFFDQGKYRDHLLLPAQGQGWYDTTWQWHPGQPGDIADGYSGGHNSINTAIQLFFLHEVGVAVLMNTRLDALIPGPTANEIAFQIARIITGASYEVPSNKVFYAGYALLDGVLLLLFVSSGWQAFHIKRWQTRYRAAKGKTTAWMLIGLNLLISIGVLALPGLFGTGWDTLLHHRPETSVPLLTGSLCLGMLGVIKMLKMRNTA